MAPLATEVQSGNLTEFVSGGYLQTTPPNVLDALDFASFQNYDDCAPYGRYHNCIGFRSFRTSNGVRDDILNEEFGLWKKDALWNGMTFLDGHFERYVLKGEKLSSTCAKHDKADWYACPNDTRSKSLGGTVDAQRQLQGRWRIEYSNGDTYEGSFKDGAKHGGGVYIWANGDKFSGSWLQGVRTGNGTAAWTSGEVYKGEWVDAVRSGFGVMDWPDGRHYEGAWQNDMMHGQGVMTWSDGSRSEGGWLQGEFVSSGEAPPAEATSESIDNFKAPDADRTK